MARLHDAMTAERRLVWMCQQARRQPGLKPLAFEALLQAQVFVWCDPEGQCHRDGDGGLPKDLSAGGAPLQLSFRTTRYPEGGVAEQAAAVFTDLAYFDAHVRQQAANSRHCYVPQTTSELVRALASRGLPLEIDPGSPHCLYLTRTQVQQWSLAWDVGRALSVPAFFGRQFVLWEPHPKLLDRLAVFLAQFDAIARAWVCQIGDGAIGFGVTTDSKGCPGVTHGGPVYGAPGGCGPGTLLLDALAPEDEERIRRALPLISEGIRLPYRPLGWVAAMPRRFEDMPAQRQELLVPVYDRAMSAKPLSRGSTSSASSNDHGRAVE